MRVFLFIPLFFTSSLFCTTQGFCQPAELVSYKGFTNKQILEDRADLILKNGDVGLTRDQLIEAFHFIESKEKHGKNSYTFHDTHLPCEIELSKPLHSYIIRKIRGGAAHIGSGCHKDVAKAILYGEHPRVIAECLSDDSARKEIHVLQKTKGAKGIVPYLGSQKRGDKYSIFLEYFPQGTLMHHLNNDPPLSETQLLKIALDLSVGLQALHAKKLVHRDLHAANVLLNISPNLCEAVLADFGKTCTLKEAKKITPQAPRSKNPPEVLLKSFASIDRLRVDVYALGCLFYQMIWRKNVAWGSLFDIYNLDKYNKAMRKKIYAHIVELYNRAKVRRLAPILQKQRDGQPLTHMESFQLLIFKMIGYKVKERPYINEVATTLEGLQ